MDCSIDRSLHREANSIAIECFILDDRGWVKQSNSFSLASYIKEGLCLNLFNENEEFNRHEVSIQVCVDSSSYGISIRLSLFDKTCPSEYGFPLGLLSIEVNLYTLGCLEAQISVATASGYEGNGIGTTLFKVIKPLLHKLKLAGLLPVESGTKLTIVCLDESYRQTYRKESNYKQGSENNPRGFSTFSFMRCFPDAYRVNEYKCITQIEF